MVTKSTNVQPGLLVKLMAQSEPSLFANESRPAIVPYRISDATMATIARMHEVAKWHARLQTEFYEEMGLVQRR